jgi:hypothetical protein
MPIGRSPETTPANKSDSVAISNSYRDFVNVLLVAKRRSLSANSLCPNSMSMLQSSSRAGLMRCLAVIVTSRTRVATCSFHNHSVV